MAYLLENPGDSGASPTIDWQLPDGVTAGDIQWPPPERLPVGPLMNFGYSGEVLLPIQLSPAATIASSGALSLQADVDNPDSDRQFSSGDSSRCRRHCNFCFGLGTLHGPTAGGP